MRKLLLLSLVALGLAFLAGCQSVPKHVNLTGAWEYTYGDNDKIGTFDIKQDGQDLTGEVNSPDGQYDITGKLTGDKFTISAIGKKNSFTASCALTGVDSFEGNYTSTDGTNGEMEGTRE